MERARWYIEGVSDNHNAYRYEARTQSGDLTFVPPCDVTITSVRFAGKVILNGEEVKSIPFECKPGDSVIVTSAMVRGFDPPVPVPVEIQWVEYPATNICDELRAYDADDEIGKLANRAADKIEELEEQIVQLKNSYEVLDMRYDSAVKDAAEAEQDLEGWLDEEGSWDEFNAWKNRKVKP